MSINHKSKSHLNNYMVFDNELSIGMLPPEECIWSCCDLALWPFWPQNVINSSLFQLHWNWKIWWNSNKRFTIYHVNKLLLYDHERTHACTHALSHRQLENRTPPAAQFSTAGTKQKI